MCEGKSYGIIVKQCGLTFMSLMLEYIQLNQPNTCFYWNTAMSICLCIAYGCFYITTGIAFGRNDAKAETPVLWPPHAKS